jgi:hypothetical protein
MVLGLQKNFFIGEEDTAINQIPGLSGTQVWILLHLGLGRVYHLFGFHNTLVWYGVLKNNQRQ